MSDLATDIVSAVNSTLIGVFAGIEKHCRDHGYPLSNVQVGVLDYARLIARPFLEEDVREALGVPHEVPEEWSA